MLKLILKLKKIVKQNLEQKFLKNLTKVFKKELKLNVK